MNKPTPNITHKSGKRSTVYYDDYKRLLEYCEWLEFNKKQYDRLCDGVVVCFPETQQFVDSFVLASTAMIKS